MRIADILSKKGSAVVTISSGSNVAEATAELARHGIGALVVSEDGYRIDGIVSERDIVRRLAEDPDSLLQRPVTSIMSSPVHTCAPEDDVERVMATMTNQRVRHVPVARDRTLCGIVSIGDVIKSRIEELQRDHKLLVEYISAR